MSETGAAPPYSPIGALREFERWAMEHPGAIPHSVSFVGSQPCEPASRDAHAVVILMQHGDEWGTLPPLLALMPWLRAAFLSAPRSARITLILGNPRAAEICDRFLDRDLNRSYPDPMDFLLAPNDVSFDAEGDYEASRAREIASVVASADRLLDLHQTHQPTAEPFFAFPLHDASLELARKIGTARMVLTRPGTKTGDDRCVDDFAQGLGIASIAIEVGRKGENPMSRSCATDSIVRFVKLFLGDAIEEPKYPELRLIRIACRFSFSGREDAVVDGLMNLSRVIRGSPLMTHQETAIAPCDGYVVFIQRPRRNAAGEIAGLVPQTALCFAEEFRP